MRLKAPVPRHGRFFFARPMSERDDAAPDIERAAAHLDAAVGRHIQQQTAGPADLRALAHHEAGRQGAALRLQPAPRLAQAEPVAASSSTPPPALAKK